MVECQIVSLKVTGSKPVIRRKKIMLMSNLLFFLLFLPISTLLGLLFIQNNTIIKNVSIFISFLNFLISLFLWIGFDKFTSQFQFIVNIAWLSEYNINISLGVDGISLFFIILTTFLIPICLITSYNVITKNIKEYYLLFLFLEICLLIVFSSLDLFIFYIFFESVLIPMFLIIGIWGSRERKIKASYYFFLYTLAGSLFMLLAIIHIFITKGTTNYQILYYIGFDSYFQKIYWLAFFIAFAAKVPILPFHIWLPEAHVEAPTAGSVLLAGILLKLGSYGLLRFSLPLFPIATVYFTPLVYTLSIFGIIYTSLTAIRQTDMKRIIAYASVAHMNLIIIGIFAFNLQGIEGSILQMISHGFVSSGLFLCIGNLYDRYHTRIIHYYSGIVHTMPFFTMIFFIYILANISIPGMSSFVGEFLIFLGIFQDNTIIAFLSATSMILGGFYSFRMYNSICFGNIQSSFLKLFYDLTFRELIIHFPLLFGIFLMGIYPNIFESYIQTSVLNLIHHMEYQCFLSNF